MVDILPFNYLKEVQNCLELQKDLNIIEKSEYGLKNIFCVKGDVTDANSRILENYTPSYTAKVVELLGKKFQKVPLDEFCAGSFGIFPFVLKNPISNTYIGGSSSGSTAYVLKTGRFAIGTDTSGSVRYPAAINGLIGFKPSYGRISRYGLIPLCEPLDTVGIIAKKLEDIKNIFIKLDVFDKRDSTSQTLRTSTFILKHEFIEKDYLDKITPIANSLYEMLMLPFVFSNTLRYDGVRFNKCNIPANATPSEIREKNRSNLLGPEVKRRILKGYTTNTDILYLLYQYRFFNNCALLDKYDFLKRFNKSDTAFLIQTPGPVKYGEKPELEDCYVIATVLGLPSISFKYENKYYELIGPMNSDYSLLEYVEKWIK